MRSLNIAICDDDKQTRDCVTAYIQQEWGGQHAVLLFADGSELIDYYREGRMPIDIILLDIYMKQVNGVEAARFIRKHDEKAIIIFLTSSKDHVFEGYDVRAFQYLLKPLRESKLISTLNDAIESAARVEDFLIVQDGKEYKRLSVAGILYVCVDGKRVMFNMLSGEVIRANGPIKDYRQVLSSYHFTQLHSGCIVNLRYVLVVNTAKRSATLSGGIELPISRSKLPVVSSEFYQQQRGNRL